MTSIAFSPLFHFVTSLSQAQNMASQIKVLQNFERDLPSADNPLLQILKETQQGIRQTKQPLDPKSLQHLHAQLMGAESKGGGRVSGVRLQKK